MFRPVPPGHHQFTSKQQNLRKLDTVIHKMSLIGLKLGILPDTEDFTTP